MSEQVARKVTKQQIDCAATQTRWQATNIIDLDRNKKVSKLRKLLKHSSSSL